MRVGLLGFGSVWRLRVALRAGSSAHSVLAAYYNTTGVMVDGKLRTRTRIAGHVRFNGAGGFNPNDSARAIGTVFECEGPCLWKGQNKILFKSNFCCHATPHRYLVVVRAREFGRLAVGEPNWSSDDVWVVALSDWGEEQEAMLLMAARGWIRTSVGKYTLKPLPDRPWRAGLALQMGDAE